MLDPSLSDPLFREEISGSAPRRRKFLAILCPIGLGVAALLISLRCFGGEDVHHVAGQELAISAALSSWPQLWSSNLGGNLIPQPAALVNENTMPAKVHKYIPLSPTSSDSFQVSAEKQDLQLPQSLRRSSLVHAAGTLVAGALLSTAVTAGLAASSAKAKQMVGGFEPEPYTGTWYEVAALKTGFAAEGQEDCHCTQGMYVMDPSNVDKLIVSTLCVHGSPEGRVSGIQGKVTCVDKEMLEDASFREKFETKLEREEMIFGKCTLKFPILPFLPAEPYDIIDTDYTGFALVQGATDRSFVQIYSRTPNPGQKFIETQKQRLIDLGYNPSLLKDTPQDCAAFNERLGKVMSRRDMQEPMATQGGMERVVDAVNAQQPQGKLSGGIVFAGRRSLTESVGDFATLLRKMLKMD